MFADDAGGVVSFPTGGSGLFDGAWGGVRRWCSRSHWSSPALRAQAASVCCPALFSAWSAHRRGAWVTRRTARWHGVGDHARARARGCRAGDPQSAGRDISVNLAGFDRCAARSRSWVSICSPPWSTAIVSMRPRVASAPPRVFDYPTPAVVAAHLLSELAGARAGVVVRSAAAALDEPLAIIGMTATTPAGSNPPRQLWDWSTQQGTRIGDSHQPGLGSGAPVRSRPGSPPHHLYARGRLRLRLRPVRRQLLGISPKSARDGPRSACCWKARGKPWNARRHRPHHTQGHPHRRLHRDRLLRLRCRCPRQRKRGGYQVTVSRAVSRPDGSLTPSA